jgi:XTP/dITP diphosphohydrolase
MELRFLSGNQHKVTEVQKILGDIGIKVIPYSAKIEEIQTEDEKKLIRDKLLKAFEMIGRRLFVEHTGLYLESMNGLPAGLTQIFWDKLQADKFSEIYGSLSNTKVVAKTIVGYCDGINIHYFEGEINGNIANSPKGDRSFQWDCVFIPEGYKQTFAELGDQKNKISMRKKALDKFAEYLARNTI